MDIQVLGAWGEFLGGIGGLVAAIGIVGSLVFVGLQIRQNTRSLEVANVWNSLCESNVNNRLLAADSELTALFYAALGDGTQLDQGKQARARHLFRAFLNVHYGNHVAKQAGTISPERWRAVASQIHTMISTPFGQDYMKRFGHHFGPDFVSEINQLDDVRYRREDFRSS